MDGYIAQQALAKKLFIGSTTNAGVTVPAYNATSQVFGLWNPAGTNKNLVLVKFQAGLVSLGTEAVSALGLSYLTNTGASIATGSPVTAFTETSAIGGFIGQENDAKGRFTLSATISAPTFFYSLGLSNNSTDISTSQEGLVQFQHDFDGQIVIPPGVYVGLGGSVAPGLVMQASLSWFEVDA